MREIKIKFVDFWPVFDYLKSDFYKILCKKYKIIISDTPDYIFYSVFGHEHLNYECIRIFYTGENIIPDFNICDYGIGFSNELKFNDRYLRTVSYTHLTLPTINLRCRSRWSPYH